MTDTVFESVLFAANGSPTNRTLALRCAEVKNVKDFGATGDGVTDDTAAIQAAVDWQTSTGNRGDIYFPPGRYVISAAIRLPQGSYHVYGSGDASAILGSFNGFMLDQLSTPYGNSAKGVVIERLNTQNTYAGQNTTASASSSFAASGSPVTINVPSLPSFVAAKCLIYILDQRIAPMPVLVGTTSSVVAGTSITLPSTAVSSGGFSDITLAFVQSYAAGASWASNATSITMPGSPPAGVPTNCLVYDYDQILRGDGTIPNIWTLALGVGNWSGSTVTFTATVSHASVGSADRLVFAPLAGCIRISSTVSGTVRDCTMNGFICVTTSQDNVNSSGQQQGAESYSILVQNVQMSAAGHAAAIGGTALYLTNNSVGLVNDYSGFWIGTRISGIANSVIGGRFEVCTYGCVLAADQNTGNEVASANLLAGFSMESNTFGILQGGGGHALISSITILCQNSFGQYGALLYGGDTTVQGCSWQGNWTGYGVYIPDAGTPSPQITFISTTIANNYVSGLGHWRLPAQAWAVKCIQCNNPAQVYTFANLPTGSGSPSPVEGDEFNISNQLGSGGGNTSTPTFGQTGAAGSGATAFHAKLGWNGASWTVMRV